MSSVGKGLANMQTLCFSRCNGRASVAVSCLFGRARPCQRLAHSREEDTRNAFRFVKKLLQGELHVGYPFPVADFKSFHFPRRCTESGEVDNIFDLTSRKIQARRTEKGGYEPSVWIVWSRDYLSYLPAFILTEVVGSQHLHGTAPGI